MSAEQEVSLWRKRPIYLALSVESVKNAVVQISLLMFLIKLYFQ
jgi:hypothetical protein